MSKLERKIQSREYLPEEVAKSGDPITYLRHSKSGERAVAIHNTIIPIEREGSLPLEISRLIEPWAGGLEERTMLDAEMLFIMHRLALLYLEKKPGHIEGPPAASKTYGCQVFASILGEPYYRQPFSVSTKVSDLFGGMAVSGGAELITDMDTLRMYLSPEQSQNPQIQKLMHSIDAALSNGEDVVSTKKFELLFLQQLTGAPLLEKREYEWRESLTTTALQYGGILVWDEPNLVQTEGFLDAANQIMEIDSAFVIPDSKAPNRFRRKHPLFRHFLTSNPPDVGGREVAFSGAVMSRLSSVTVPGISQEKLKNLYHFLMTGRQPDIVFGGVRYSGRSGYKTPYLHLKDMPARDLWVETVVNMQMQLEQAVADKKIAKREERGGNHTYDLREVIRMLGAITVLMNAGSVVRNGGRLEQNTSWSDMLKQAAMTVFVESLQQEDQPAVRDIFLNLPIWDEIENTSLPSWAPRIKGASINRNPDGSISFS